MIVLSGADVVLADRVLSPGTVVVEGEQIVEVLEGTRTGPSGSRQVDLRGHCVVPGFVDMHVHGIEGLDSLDGGHVIADIARRMPRHGVTAFCPTSIACTPADLRTMFGGIRDARADRPSNAARVLPAHLESNFINPEFNGAQPLTCLRRPVGPWDGDFTGAEIVEEIDAARAEVGIVTLAPELDGALDLIRHLVKGGTRVSLGHSGASYEEAIAGIEAGARHATHLFNRMPPLGHRAPGLVGAVLEHEDVAVEIICDGVHVHPAMVRLALHAKSPRRAMAITDGTAGSGLPPGSRAHLGGREIVAKDAAYLQDGTLAGSVLTMDRAFRFLVSRVGLNLVDAATVCAATPASRLGLRDTGVVAPGMVADLVVLDRSLDVSQTYIAGRPAWP